MHIIKYILTIFFKKINIKTINRDKILQVNSSMNIKRKKIQILKNINNAILKKKTNVLLELIK